MAVYVSGRGSNFLALLEAFRRGDLSRGERSILPALLISNKADAGAIDYAKQAGIPYIAIPAPAPDFGVEKQLEVLQAHRIDAIALAGYLRPVPDAVILRYARRIVNIHPAPLPRFGGHGMYGHHVHRAVLASGVRWSGPTVHWVDEVYDRGAVIAHRRVPVKADDDVDSLARRVLEAEHDLYWRVIASVFGNDTDALNHVDET